MLKLFQQCVVPSECRRNEKRLDNLIRLNVAVVTAAGPENSSDNAGMTQVMQ